MVNTLIMRNVYETNSNLGNYGFLYIDVKYVLFQFDPQRDFAN